MGKNTTARLNDGIRKEYKAVPPKTLSSGAGLTRILIIKPGKSVKCEIRAELCRQGYQVDMLNSEKLGLLAAYETHPDLIILDGRHSNLPNLDICQHLRRRLSQIPIILLASVCELSDSTSGFEAGVDDCIAHPFQIEELLARVRVRLRYFHKENLPILQLDKLTLDCQKREVCWGNQKLKLTSKEFDLLKYFMIHGQRVVSRHELMEHLWGTEYDVCSNVVEAYICRLRLKLEQYSQKRLIQTVYGVGYKLHIDQNGHNQDI
jgi:DNA-binding response OmpR family regulator